MRVINFWLQIYSLSDRPHIWRLMVIGHLKIARFPEISWLKQKLIGTILLSDQFFGIPIQTKCHKWTSNRSVKKYFRRPYDNAANGQFTYQGEFTVSLLRNSYTCSHSTYFTSKCKHRSLGHFLLKVTW